GHLPAWERDIDQHVEQTADDGECDPPPNQSIDTEARGQPRHREIAGHEPDRGNEEPQAVFGRCASQKGHHHVGRAAEKAEEWRRSEPRAQRVAEEARARRERCEVGAEMTLPAWRRGLVVRLRQASAAQAKIVKLTPAANTKIASQPNSVSRMPPISGATIGINTTTEVTSPIMEAACSRSKRAGMTRGRRAGRVGAASECAVRATGRFAMFAAKRGGVRGRVASASPASTTGRRPKRSDSGPNTSCAAAKPMR